MANAAINWLAQVMFDLQADELYLQWHVNDWGAAMVQGTVKHVGDVNAIGDRDAGRCDRG